MPVWKMDWQGKAIFNKNNQYTKDLISAADIMKNYWKDDSGTRKIYNKTQKNKF